MQSKPSLLIERTLTISGCSRRAKSVLADWNLNPLWDTHPRHIDITAGLCPMCLWWHQAPWDSLQMGPTTSCSPSNHSWLGATWLSVGVLGGLGLILADWKSIHCEIHIPDTLISLLTCSMCLWWHQAPWDSLQMGPTTSCRPSYPLILSENRWNCESEYWRAWSVLADWNLNPLWDTHPRHIDITADLFHVSNDINLKTVFKWILTTSCRPSYPLILSEKTCKAVSLTTEWSLVCLGWLKPQSIVRYTSQTLWYHCWLVPCVQWHQAPWDSLQMGPTTSCRPSHHSWLGALLWQWVQGVAWSVLADNETSIHCEIHIPDTLISLLTCSMCPW